MLVAKRELQRSHASLQKEALDHWTTQGSLQQESTDRRTTQASLQQEITAHAKTKASLQQTSAELQKTEDPAEEFLQQLQAAAKPVPGEKDKKKKLRALRVMSMLRADGRAELWQQVAHDIMSDGWLDMRDVITKRNLCDLVFVLSSPYSAGQITQLVLSDNPVLGEVEGARTLGAGLGSGSLGQLEELRLDGCHQNDTSLGHIVDGIIDGCPRLTRLELTKDKLKEANGDTLRRLLRQVPRLEIGWWLTRPSWCDQLKAEFPGRRI
ncbi:hypothetical protein NP493_1104g04016 [Ridgeia piscesae]|uniref:Uncharacterized protein n=1 Tax=Ridgeia piscesae TaxID=27915 RepID=A0AAD9KHA2_RIDPI|nr:hypothetical protein NP493_1104g04016 [Ridgeia piscesae]